MSKIKIPEISSIPESDLKKTPQSVLNFIAEVMKVVQQMAAKIEELEEEVKNLKMQLAKNSSNSSKPPSSDGFNKPKKTSSLRGKSGKKVGAQIGHKSSSLEPIENPDKIVEHDLGSCSFCGSNDLDTTYIDRRQVIDIPKPQKEVTEHRIFTKKCRSCKKQTKASFPENIKAAVQYGDKTKALVTYLNVQQLVPVKRITETMADCYDLPVSSGFVAKTLKNFCSQLKKNQFEELVTEALLAEKVLHVDETGMRCQSGLKWLHTTSSVRFVLYKMHKKRGKNAIDDINILPRFTGFIVHDCLSAYFGYPNCKNVLCNAHISRELKGISPEENWAEKLYKLLVRILQAVREHNDQGYLPQELMESFIKEYDDITAEALLVHKALPVLAPPKRGRLKQRPGKNLLDRIVKYREFILRFANDFSIPFTNNLAEQDLRMNKVKQKISGCFRTEEGLIDFCLMRSFITTGRKQGWPLLESIENVFENKLAPLAAPP